MPAKNMPARRQGAAALKPLLIVAATTLALLALLAAIDRPHWLRLKPATGTAAAMSQAASLPGEKPARAQ